MEKRLKDVVEGSWDIEQSLLPRKHTIYHYTSPGGLLGILKDGGEPNLFFTQYDSLNDISERDHAVELIHSVCKKCLKNKIFDQSFYELVIDCIQPQKILFAQPSAKHPGTIKPSWHEYDTYICSFSENEDSLPMWNYYSKSHHYEGYNLGFYIEHELLDLLNGYKLKVARVIYSDQDKEKLIKNMLVAIAKKMETEERETGKSWLMSWLSDSINDLVFACKKSCFAHEEEVRMILRVPQDYRNTGIGRVSKRLHRDNNGFIIPYVEYTFAKGMVYEIHIAPLLNSKVAKQNVDDLLKQRGYPSVPVIPSEIPIRF